MLSSEKEKAIVDRVENDLLTPFGLRTLSSDHPSYRGHYHGDSVARDTAYHNGTAWPWLLGAYVKAYRKVHNYSKDSLEDMRALLQGFDMHLETAGIGTISEVFDGDYPYSAWRLYFPGLECCGSLQGICRGCTRDQTLKRK